MLLDDNQKAIFSRWLQIQISSSEGLVQEHAKLGMPAALTEAFAKKERTEQMACKIVLRMIESGESMNISGS